MRRFLYFMIAVFSMVLILGGCGSQSGSADKNTGEGPAGSEEVTQAAAEDQAKKFNWLDYNLTLEELRDVNDDDHFSLKEAPEDSRYILVKLISADSEIKTEEISEESTKTFILKDSSGGEYESGMWAVWGVEFDDEKGFSTKETQEGFNLIYLVSKNIETDDLHLEMK